MQTNNTEESYETEKSSWDYTEEMEDNITTSTMRTIQIEESGLGQGQSA